MKCKISTVLVFVVAFASCAAAKSVSNLQMVSAVIVGVEPYEESSNYVGSNPSDAPLQAEVHVYHVAVRTDCGTYVGRYKSAFDYLPEILVPSRHVEVRVQKHLLNLIVPGEDDYTMYIIQRPRGNNC